MILYIYWSFVALKHNWYHEVEILLFILFFILDFDAHTRIQSHLKVAIKLKKKKEEEELIR